MKDLNLTQFCTEWLDAWTGNRPEYLLSYYAPEAFYSDPARPNGLRGHGEILPYFQKLLAKNPDWKWRALEILPSSQGCALKWEALIPNEGKTLRLVGADIVEIHNGKITRNEVYFDPTPLRS